jgi:hypothetical protein
MKLRLFLFSMAIMTLLAAPLRGQALAQPVAWQDCGSSQSCTAHLSANVTAGNSLIAVVRIGNVQSVAGTTITDSLSNSWVLDAFKAQSSDDHLLAVYRVASAKAGATVFTVSNQSADTMRVISLAEISGLASGSPDASSLAAGSGTAAQPGAVSSSQPGDYVLLAASTGNNQSFSTTQPFLMESEGTKGAYADLKQTQAGSVSPSITFGVKDQWAAIAVAYKTTGSPKLPLVLSVHYDDGTPVTGTAVLSSLANNVKITIQTWPIPSNGQVTLYCPIVNTGTYQYDFLDPSGNLLQSYVILPGAFISLISPAHSILGSITLSKSTHNVTIPVSFAFQ